MRHSGTHEELGFNIKEQSKKEGTIREEIIKEREDDLM